MPVVPLADETLLSRVQAIITKDLKGLTSAPSNIDQSMDKLCDAIRTSNQHRNNGKGPQPVSEKLQGAYDIIARLTNTLDEKDLPAFWMKFANTTKGEQAATYEGAVKMRANQATGNGVYASPTPTLLEMIAGARFASSEPEDLTRGLSVFLMASTLRDSRTAEDQTFVYESIYGNTGAPSMRERKELIAPKVVFPESVSQCLRQVKCFSTLWDVLVGENHPAAKALQSFVRNFDKVLLSVEDKFGTNQVELTSVLTQLLLKFHILVMHYVEMLVSTPAGEEVHLPKFDTCLLYTSPSPRDRTRSRMPSSA